MSDEDKKISNVCVLSGFCFGANNHYCIIVYGFL